jgi:hypothetical protein
MISMPRTTEQVAKQVSTNLISEAIEELTSKQVIMKERQLKVNCPGNKLQGLRVSSINGQADSS